MKILIFGSCVTRDAFTFDSSEKFQLLRYFARSSLATAFNSSPAPDNYTSQLTSAFQKKIVGADFSKEFKTYFTEQDFDYLVIDFIDDRYDIFRFYDGAKVLLSAELRQTDFLQKNVNNGVIIKGGSEEWFDEWKKGCLEFIDVLKNNGLLDKVIVNKVFWTNTLSNGETFLEEDAIKKPNAFLQRQYEFIGQYLNESNFINYSNRLLKSNKEHRWGA